MKNRILFLLLAAAMVSLARAGDDPIVLDAKDATLTGQVQYNEKGLCLDFWKGEGSAASWKLPPMKEGTYNVSLNYSLLGAVAKGRQFEISSGSDKKQINGIPKTGSWDAFRDKILVPLKIAKTDASFTITIVKIPPDAYLMNLKSVTLKKSP